MRSVNPVSKGCKPDLPRILQQDTESYSNTGVSTVSINSQSDIAANLQVGPTDHGMVRIYVEGEGLDLPLDFDPEEATEIAEELLAAADAARKMTAKGDKSKPRGKR